MQLFQNPYSSNSRRVLLTAEHLCVPLDLIAVDLGSAVDRKLLAEINPNGKLPVLEDGDYRLWESCAIMQYLADITPEQTLYPLAARERADVNRWMFWSCQHLSPAVGVLTWERLWKGMVGQGAADPQQEARGEAELIQFGQILDEHLAQRTWLCGEALTLADFAAAAPLMYLDRAALPLRQFPNLMAWFDRIQALEAWKSTDFDW